MSRMNVGRWKAAVAGLGLVVLLLGCRSSTGGASPGGGAGGGPGTAGAGGGAMDGAADHPEDAQSDAGGAGGGADAGGASSVAAVVVQNITYLDMPNRYSEIHGAITDVPAAFLDEITLCAGDTPTFATVGGCEVIECAIEGPDIVGVAYAGLLGLLVDRGPITASSGNASATATYGDTYTWANHDWNTPPPASLVWQPGADVRVVGGGQGDLPAFDGSLTFPPHVSAAGALLASGIISVPAASPFDVTWTATASGGTAPPGNATIELLGQGAATLAPSPPFVAAKCHAPLAAGSFTLPPALLAYFAAGPNALLTVSSDTRQSVAAGGRAVSLVARDVIEATLVFTR